AILETDTQGFADQQGVEAAAVDEKVAGDFTRLGREHAFNVPGGALIDLHDIRQNMADSELLSAMPREEGSELAGVQMISIVGGAAVFRLGDGLRGESVITEPPLRRHEITEGLVSSPPHPMGYQIHLAEALRQHQRVVIGVALLSGRPAGELTSLLERGVALLEQLSLRYAHLFQR